MGARKYCDIEYVTLEDDYGREVPGVRAECVECGATTESFGQEAPSVRRCLALMRDECECPDGEDAFFTCDELEE